MLFALDRSGEKGYSELLALASGRPLETVKNHQALPTETRAHLAQQTIPAPRQRTHDGYTVLRLVERDFPNAISRDDTPLSYSHAEAGEGPSFANVSELMAHISQRATPDEEATLRELITCPRKPGQTIIDDVPKLRQGLMAATASDWVARLHHGFSHLAPGQEEQWMHGLVKLLQEIDPHRSMIRIRKEPGSEGIISILQQMDFRVRDWLVRPTKGNDGRAPSFRPYRTWRDILAGQRPLQLRPSLKAGSFSYEGARWAVLGHLLYLRLRR
jgi:hypothetical protein